MVSLPVVVQYKQISGSSSWVGDDGNPYTKMSDGGFLKRKLRNSRKGYLRFNAIVNGKHRTIEIHIEVASLFVGPRPSFKHEASHKDDNKLNNSALNIAWETHRENVGRTIRNIPSIAGVKNAAIDLINGHSQLKVASRRGLSRWQVGDINNGDCYKDITGASGDFKLQWQKPAYV